MSFENTPRAFKRLFMLLAKKTASILLWSGIWICIVFIVYEYLKKEYSLRSETLRHPSSHVCSILAASNHLGPRADSDERINLEAETGDTDTGKSIDSPVWENISSEGYSQGAARFTHTPGALLVWPVELPPGNYD